MSFEVETGTGSETATSYITVAEFRAYWTDRGTDYTSTSDATIQGWAILATEYIDGEFNFMGTPVYQVQALEFPRADIYDKCGYLLPSDEIPIELKNATCYLAAQANSGLDSVDSGVKSKRVGPISTTYLRSSGYKDFPVVRKLLKYFIVSGNSLMRVT